MNNLFGTGRVAPGTGILLAASPAAVPLPLLSAAIAYNAHVDAFHAEAAGSGQEGAPLATAVALQNALAHGQPDGRRGARAGAGQCHRLLALPARRGGLLPLGHRSARRGARHRLELMGLKN